MDKKGLHIPKMVGSFSTQRKSCQSTVLSATMDPSLSTRTNGTDPVHSTCDDSNWRAYETCVREIMNEQRVLKKCQDFEPVQRFLLDQSWPFPKEEILNAQTYQEGKNNNNHSNFRFDLDQRKQSFMGQMGFDKNQKDYLERCLTYIGDRSASRSQPAPLPIAWMKWRVAGCPARENSFSTYMYGLGLIEKEGNVTNALAQQCLWDTVSIHDLLFPPNEKTITLRIQSYITQGNPQAAEDLLQSLAVSESEGTENDAAGTLIGFSRLRTFLPILAHYCEKGEIGEAWRLFGRMREAKGVYMDAATYAMLIGSFASQGYFEGKQSLAGTDLNMNGQQLFDQVFSLMASDILELTQDAAETIYKGFMASSDDDAIRSSNLSSIPRLSSLSDNKFSIGRVSVNSSTGECEVTGAKLRLLELDEKQKEHVRDTLLDMAFSLQEEYREMITSKGKSVTDLPTGDFSRSQLQNFSTWLTARSKNDTKPFTAIVDGANIAHFGSGTVQYGQVKLAVEELERMGENPLVVMPRKYTAKKFFLRHIRKNQELDERDLQAIEELKNSGKMFIVPASCFDDYYWMIASVAYQKGLSQVDGNMPGLRPILVTNDQMRDHRLALLEPRPFRRWTSCHLVNYAIEPYDKDPWETRSISFNSPNAFSREIQSNDSRLQSGQKIWHIPVENWEEPDRLVSSWSLADRG